MFRGCAAPLVGASIPRTDHFGTDGLGDVIKDRDPQWEEKIQSEHAVDAMIRLVSENRNQVRNCLLWGLSVLSGAVLKCAFCRSP